MTADTGYVIAVDSGGTFTDCVVISADGAVARDKAHSTPDDFSRGVLDAVRKTAQHFDLSARELLGNAVLFAHGTTVATNALLTRSGSPTALLTTAGHEDAVIIGRTDQKVAGLSESEVSDVASLNKAAVVVPRTMIHGVMERVDVRGAVVCALELDGVRRSLRELVAAGAESVAVCLLWSFINPDHERQIRDLVRAEFPELRCSISSELAPLIGEYERAAATMINAYLLRGTSTYLTSLEGRLRTEGLATTPVLMQSSGGVAALERAKDAPVRLLTSGPVGGVMGAKALGDLIGCANVVTTDVGGTSFDVGLVVDGLPQASSVAVYDKYRVNVAVIDVATIGAGGGSIAWVESETGILRVGPQSAGAQPGPACYGLGGTSATVTDANVVARRVNPDNFLGGDFRLDADAARSAVATLADQLGMSIEKTALGIIRVADAHMADLVRQVTIERGHDPRDFVLFAFGGAGPMHAAAYGPAAGCHRILVPSMAAEFSAFGIAASDALVVEETSAPMNAPFDAARIGQIFMTLEPSARRQLQANGFDDSRITLRRSVRLRYRGQVHEVETPVSEGSIDDTSIENMLEAFTRLYESNFGVGTTYAGAELQAITFRVHAHGRLVRPRLRTDDAGLTSHDPTDAVSETRSVLYDDGPLMTAVYAGQRLRSGAQFSGPAIIESADTTIVVHPGQNVRVDHLLNVIIESLVT